MSDEPARHVVVAGLLCHGGRALLLHRSPQRRWYPDAWDLPGGHVLEGEEPRAALARELQEELGIEAEVPGHPFEQVWGDEVEMTVWVVERWLGTPVNAAPDEHDALAWLTAEETRSLRLADPRLPALVHAALQRSV